MLKIKPEMIRKLIAVTILELFILTQPGFMLLAASNHIDIKDNPVSKNSLPTLSQGTELAGTGKQTGPRAKTGPGLQKAAGLLSPDADFVLELGQVKLEIPAGAVSKTTEISIEKLSVVENLNPGMNNVTGQTRGYRFLPSMEFLKEVKITLPYAREQVNNSYALSQLFTYFYHEKNKQWERLSRLTVNEEAGTITSLTNHFTDFINSTLKLPESPKPLSFNPNSIKDIKAAHAMAGIPDIKGLEGNASGSAHFNIPLTIPPGRNGAAPGLALSYNSQGACGWLGQGFDIHIPAITIDTKYGLPAYDASDSYLYNGEELVQTDHSGSTRLYQTRCEGRFEEIIRQGDIFKIRDKSGTLSVYGEGDARLDGGKGVYQWFLKRVTDTNGNYVEYKYTTIENYTYLKEIIYTGHTSGTSPLYQVRFELEDRQDIRVDCRGKFVSKLSKRLSHIRIYSRGHIVRRYEFNYSYNDFFKSQLDSYQEYVRNGSESEANKHFYTYQFKYKSIKTGPNQLDGYQDVVELANFHQKGSNNFGNNSGSAEHSFGGGGTVYVGIGFMQFLCSAGLNLGFGIDYNYNQMRLMDLDGDGLTDFIRKDFSGSALEYKRNTGFYSFDDARAITGESTLETGMINEYNQISFSVGTSGGMSSIASASFGGKFNWSLGYTSFMDLNGDGFMDYIPSDYGTPVKGFYLINKQGNFKRNSWGNNANLQPSTPVSNDKIADLKKSLYLVDPVIKWKSYRRGIVELNLTAEKIEAGEHEDYDGVKIDVYKNDVSQLNQPDDGLLSAVNSTFNLTKEINIDHTSDMLYFKANSIDDIGNDQVKLAIEIVYKKIYLRDDMKEFFNNGPDIPEKYSAADFENLIHTITDVNEKQTITLCYTLADDSYFLKKDLSDDQKKKIRQIFTKYNISGVKYYPYQGQLYPVLSDGVQFWIEIAGEEHTIGSPVIHFEHETEQIGAVKAKGMLFDVCKNQTGQILYKKWLKDYGSNVEVFIENPDQTITPLMPGDYSVSRQGTKIELTEKSAGYAKNHVFNHQNDVYHYKQINYDLFMDLSTDINQDATTDLSACYQLQPDHYFHLLPDYDPSVLNKIKNKLMAKGLAHYEKMERKLTIYSDIAYTVQREDNPSGTVSELVVADADTENQGQPEKTSFIYIEDLDAAGNTRAVKQYLHVFNNSKDFSPVNLAGKNTSGKIYIQRISAGEFAQKLSYLRERHAKEDPNTKTNQELLLYVYEKSADGLYYEVNEERYHEILEGSMTYGERVSAVLYNLGYGDEYFTGGVYNWYYGEWNGDYGWKTEKIGIVDEKSNIAYLNGTSHLAAGGTITGDGQMVANKIGLDIWKGSDFEYTGRKGDVSGITDNVTRYFACYIGKEILNPCRKGGDSIKRIPDTGESSYSATGFSLDQYLNRSFTWGLNVGATAGPVTGNYIFSETEAIVDFMDLNGDRYPDQVKMNPGSGTLEVAYNNQGINFNGSNSFCGLHSNLRSTYTNTAGAGFGLTAQMIKNWKTIKTDGLGNIKSVTSQNPEASGGGSVNGTFSGSAVKIDWIDINGDGLVDQVLRDPLADSSTVDQFKVKLNCGDHFEDHNWPASGWSQDQTPLTTNNVIRNSWLYGGNFGASLGGVTNQTINTSVGANLNFGVNARASIVDLIDINGDGLPDQVMKEHGKNFIVKFNLGTRFSEEVIWSVNQDWGVDTSDIASGCMSDLQANAGSLCGHSDATVGAFDYAKANSAVNQMSKSSTEFDIRGILDAISYSGNFSVSMGVDVSAGIPVFTGIMLYITPSGTFAYSRSGAHLQMADIDGDHLPDHVLTLEKNAESKMLARVNNAKQVGLLTTIITPSQGVIELEYTRSVNTVAMPHSRYLLSKVTRKDGLGHHYTTKYSYGNGYYERAERSFFGFDQVRKINPDGSYIDRFFYNDSYIKKGLCYKSETRDSEDYLLTAADHHFAYIPVNTKGSKPVIYPQLAATDHYYYDLCDSSQCINTRMEYVYDQFGNVTRVRDLGDAGQTKDDILIKIDYDFSNSSQYIVAHPKLLEVRDRDNTLLKRKSASYDSRGNMTRLIQYLFSSSQNHITRLQYDQYGNLTGITDALGYSVNYSYDLLAHSFITETRDSFGYTSAAVYDYRFGVETDTIDTNNNRFRKDYDDFGRLLNVWTGYDNYIGGVPAVSFEYFPDEFPARAVTHNKVHFEASDKEVLDTVVISDGLRRVIQTKKEGEVELTGDTVPTYGMNISGRIEYDDMGRVWKKGRPLFRAGYNTAYYGEAKLKNAVINHYDGLGRVTQVTLADGSQIKNDYKIEKGMLKTTVTDPEGNRKISYQDMRDNLLKIEQFNGGKMITTRYEYDLLKQITAVIDTQGNRTNITYDSLGRRTSINNPDSGLIEYFFDINGNLIKKTDPNLRKKSAGILYTYQYNRLKKVDYPDKKDVEYSYGAPGSVNNTAGRLLSITGESGSTTFEYGLLGQQTRIIKTLNRLAPSAPQLTYESSYGFDYLGRMQWIRYPDQETVYYEYDRGGQVRSVYGEHRGTRFDYIKQIHYDCFGQRVYLKYGNNVETRYRYDEKRRWLSELNTVNGEGKVFQALDYTFDKVGNILIMENSAALKTSRQEFAYDDLYQLTGAKGIYWDKTSAALNRRNEYTQTYVYDDIGNLTHKTSYNYKWPDNSKPEHLNYNLAYHYAAAHPHRATRIGEMYYTYDSNGNVIRISNKPGDGQNSSNSNSDTFSPPFDTGANTGWAGVAYGREPGGNGGNEQSNQYKWDEENRLIHAKVNGNEIDFLYNAGGERTAKQGKDGEVIYYDKMYQVKTNVSPLHITKHIFLGSTRVVSKLSHELGPIDLEYEKRNAYYYHGDHLGSSNYMTDYEGNEYEHYEYTPFGEMWVEEESDSLDKINFKFTSKELDEETGLYYFGARYLDAKASRWLSCDPALGDYLPQPAISDEAKKYNKNLPGMGGVFNPVNLSLYHYAGNNPLKYTDPDGLFVVSINRYKADVQRQWAAKNVQLGQNTLVYRNGVIPYNLHDFGCYVTALTNVLNSFKHDKYNSNPNKVYTIYDSNNVKDAFLDGDGYVKPYGVGALKILNQNDYVKSLGIKYSDKSPDKLSQYANDTEKFYFIIGEVPLGDGSHFFNILSGPDADGNIQCWDGWQEGSPYVTKNISDLTSIRVFQMPNKDAYEQFQQLNLYGINPDKSYLESAE